VSSDQAHKKLSADTLTVQWDTADPPAPLILPKHPPGWEKYTVSCSGGLVPWYPRVGDVSAHCRANLNSRIPVPSVGLQGAV
jgi:hypothetical protein